MFHVSECLPRKTRLSTNTQFSLVYFSRLEQSPSQLYLEFKCRAPPNIVACEVLLWLLQIQHIMHFVPTPSEVVVSHSKGSLLDLPSEPSDLSQGELYVPGSKWGKLHLKALRVHLVEPVSPERIPSPPNSSTTCLLLYSTT